MGSLPVNTRLVIAARFMATMVLMLLGSLAMLAAAMVTGFRCRRLYNEIMAASLGRMILRVWGITMRLHGRNPAESRQAVYISNHTSTIDVFVLIALGLPNTRFFLSGFLRWLLPLGLIGYLIGIFWTVDQEFPQRRTEIFRRASRVLKETGESVYLSPEGVRITNGQIGPFNKGAFHLATDLQAPIVPLYILIPDAINGGKGWYGQPGTVDVYFGDSIDTTDWLIENLVENKEKVREFYLRWHRELRYGRTG